MLFPHLPKPVYEALPMLYMAGGVTAAFWSNNVAGMLSGMLLAFAGWQLRVERKREQSVHAERLKLLDARLRRAQQAAARKD